jgi:4-amino-4-deoxy-L-arabinose transferase-like glycosyltransferase
LAITSEIFILNTVLVMLEMSGALLGLLLLYAADQADATEKSPRRTGWLALAALVAVLLFLTKYSFGLFYLPGFMAALVTATWPTNRRTRLDLLLVTIIYAGLIGLWLLVTDRATMLLFFADHPQRADLFSADNLVYHIQRWLNGYSPHASIGWITLGLAVVAGVRRWQWLAVRTAVWSVLAAFVILGLSPTDEPRHLVPVAPALWLLAGVGLVEVLHWLPPTRRDQAAVIVPLALLVLIALCAWPAVRSLRTELVDEMEGSPALLQAQDFALQQVDLDQPVLLIGELNDQNGLLAVRWRAATRTQRSLQDLALDYFPFENFEHSLARTRRKPQIATVDPTFPRQYMDEILARQYYAAVVEMVQVANYFGPRASNPDDPLARCPTREQQFEAWRVIVYTIKTANQVGC